MCGLQPRVAAAQDLGTEQAPDNGGAFVHLMAALGLLVEPNPSLGGSPGQLSAFAVAAQVPPLAVSIACRIRPFFNGLLGAEVIPDQRVEAFSNVVASWLPSARAPEAARAVPALCVGIGAVVFDFGRACARSKGE